MKRLLLLVLLFVVGTCVGCAARGSEKYEDYRNVIDNMAYYKYAFMTTKDVVLDLTDIVSWDMAYGPCFLIDIQPTKILEFGAGYADVGKFGWRNRFTGFWTERRAEGGLSMWYYRSLDFQPVFGTPGMWDFAPVQRNFAIRNNDDRHWMDFGFQAYILFGGFSAYFSPMQTVDFLANLIEYPYNIVLRRPLNYLNFRPPEFDFANDDSPARLRREFSLRLIDPGKSYLPAEKIDELFRSPW